MMTHQNKNNSDKYGFTMQGWTNNPYTEKAMSNYIREKTNSLLQANSQHDKNEKLFMFLKKQAKKQMARSTTSLKNVDYEPIDKQRKMMKAAMDDAVKVGPVSVPAKLKKAHDKAQKHFLKK